MASQLSLDRDESNNWVYCVHNFFFHNPFSVSWYDCKTFFMHLLLYWYSVMASDILSGHDQVMIVTATSDNIVFISGHVEG